MILGLDPGLASCGWAAVDHRARVVALGVVTSEPDRAIAKSTDRARRIRTMVAELERLVDAHGVRAVAAEAALTFGHVGAASAQNLAWGAIIALAHLRGLQLVEVVAKDWQRAIVPGEKRPAYKAVEAAVARYVGELALAPTPRAQRTHALDAAAIGMFAALRETRRVA